MWRFIRFFRLSLLNSGADNIVLAAGSSDDPLLKGGALRDQQRDPDFSTALEQNDLLLQYELLSAACRDEPRAQAIRVAADAALLPAAEVPETINWQALHRRVRRHGLVGKLLRSAARSTQWPVRAWTAFITCSIAVSALVAGMSVRTAIGVSGPAARAAAFVAVVTLGVMLLLIAAAFASSSLREPSDTSGQSLANILKGFVLWAVGGTLAGATCAGLLIVFLLPPMATDRMVVLEAEVASTAQETSLLLEQAQTRLEEAIRQAEAQEPAQLSAAEVASKTQEASRLLKKALTGLSGLQAVKAMHGKQ